MTPTLFKHGGYSNEPKDLSQTIPYGDLAIIPLESSKMLGKKVDDHIVSWRKKQIRLPRSILIITKRILM